MKKYTIIFSTLILGTLNHLGWTQATSAPQGPGWHLSNRDYLFNDTASLLEEVTSGFAEPHSGQGISSFASNASAGAVSIGNEADEITPEIQELARGLQNDPVRIYAYCKNHIKYEHYFGSKKGATLTLLEGSGNDFDTSSLMVALLRSAGYSARYRYGAGYFTASELEQWWGLPSKSDLSVMPFPYLTDTEFRNEFGLTGHPADTRTLRFLLNKVRYTIRRGYPRIASDFYGNVWNLPHVWVQFTAGGTYQADPSRKILLDSVPPVDLKSAIGYNRATVLNEVGGTTGSNYVQNLNEAALDSRLVAYTTALNTWVRANDPNMDVSTFIRRSRVEQREYKKLSDIEAVNYATPSWLSLSTWDAIPTDWMSKLTVTLGDYNYSSKTFNSTQFTGTLNMPGLKGRKLSLVFNGNTASFEIDDTSWTSVTVGGSMVDMMLSVNHPHGRYDNAGVFADDGSDDQEETNRYQKNDSYAYAILYGYSPSGRLVRKRQEILDAYKRDGLSDTSKEVVTELLNIMGLNWLLQVELNREIVTSQYNVSPLSHHQFGRMAQEQSYYIDVGVVITGNESFVSDHPKAQTGFQLESLFVSAFEHALIEQFQGADKKAASTVKILQLANEQNMRVYRANASNWSSVRSTLSSNGYDSLTLDDIESYVVDDDGLALVPESPSVTLDSWTGTGYAIATDNIAGMIISGNYFGGYLLIRQ